MKVDGPFQEVTSALKLIDGIESVEKRGEGNGINEYIISSTQGADIRREIPSVVVKKGWGLLEQKPLELSLEDIFVKLVTKES